MASECVLILDYFNQYLINTLSGYTLEFLAIISGLYFLKKNPNASSPIKNLVYFLWFSLFWDIVGSYAPIAYFSKNEYFGFVENTPFNNNYWWFNIYMIVSFSFFIYFFNSFISNTVVNKRLRLLIIVFVIVTVINLLLSDIFFNGYSIFTSVVGSVIVMVSIFLYYFDLLKRDDIISLKRQLPIYISIGVLIYNLTITPSDIYSQYFNTHNDIYIKFSGLIVLLANIIMYGTFITGFIVCAKSNPNKGEILNL